MRKVSRLGGNRVAALVRVEARTKYSADYAEDSEISPGLHRNVALGRIRGLEHHRAIAASIRLDRRFLANPRRYDIVVAWLLARVDHYVVAIVDAASNHAVALHLEKEDFVGRNEAAIYRYEPVTMLGNEGGFAGVNSSVERDRLSAHRRAIAEEVYSA